MVAFADFDSTTDMRATLSVQRFGTNDPTTRLGIADFWRATLTPQGPATLHLWWRPDGLDAEAWGDGANWLLAGVADLIGARDTSFRFAPDAHPVLLRAQRNHPGWRIGASRTLYHELLPVVLGQRVTAGEAIGQWSKLCYELGEVAPGPNDALRLPPAPHVLAGKPAWWFHPFGIEAKRAEALRVVAKYAPRINEWSMLSAAEASAKLSLLRGIGPWTIGSAVGPCFGDPDAVPVGDFHIPNMVCWALAGRARGTDDEMLELLAPYSGQRGRAIGLLMMDGNAAPKFGPRQRIQPMHRR
jgi:3-methyladenine DNA glycosylase/8-oxoguanine DNA glycosylase